jgi:hypothetical protein
MEVLKKRLAKFSLEVAEDKTRILPIGRFKGTKEEFDFLGFYLLQHQDQTREIPCGNPHKQEETEGEEASGESVDSEQDGHACE